MDKSDKMMDGFLLCDYNEDYNGIYVSSEDEADEELYYERQLQEVQYKEQYENRRLVIEFRFKRIHFNF